MTELTVMSHINDQTHTQKNKAKDQRLTLVTFKDLMALKCSLENYSN